MSQSDGTHSFTQRLCFNIYTAHRSFNRFYQSVLTDSGVTYPKLVVLHALREAGPMTVSDLSARAGVEPNTLSPLLKKMEGFGVLTRKRSPEDERRVTITMTEKGSALLAQADDAVQRGFAELNLDPEQCMQALQFLEQARAQLDQSNPPKFDADAFLKKWE